ncbi:PREDICTED: inactive glucose-1-phosphate adenylyltransferase small subunit 2, chloroplastic-like isoform X2 [Camelina sativa]|uniref:Inactive glucose-1-phosphate adenylyltransferase small subunit 2, chloroplastic-like isoform X1 n=1 Tax=Camelina sativa TaxID=90675 RepID=A0ABM0XF99_CAMSA|nr:PREDICTED: inactive glucose-1-phosphate adenylyltransferase small subunit 2, chloroplastic-like isoform X1 [Camelina sativa]XP_010485108.1 PREDICTED: inactive glucose-1-phosphate adenylyltransferase small subunit 2, chloroplastic-like isoform X2 [Camelina sativa]
MQISSSSSSAKLTNLHMMRSSSDHQHQWRHNYNLKQLFVPSSCPNLSVSNSPLKQSVSAIVFGGGPDPELYPLNKTRSKGAIPIAANYRLIDAVISNCINSDITKIYAITQFNSTSLNSHLSRAYSGFGIGKDRFVEVIAAYQSLEDQGWFQGSADAIRRCLWVFEEFPVTEFLVLPGYHLYKMDYKTLIEDHRRCRADITIVGLSSATDHDSGFGFMEVDSSNHVTRFTIKPEKGQQDIVSVENRATTTRSEGTSSCCVPSTGIYVIGREQMVKLLRECLVKAKDLASEVIPGAISGGMKVKAHMFDGYWEDVKTVGAYYRANMDSIKSNRFYDRQCPLYTMPRCLPPSSMSEAVITDSIIGDGCILDRCVIRGSVVGMRTRIADEVIVEDSIIVGSDIYEMEEDVRRKGREKKIDIRIGIGEKSRVRRAIVDKNARIGKNVMIINRDNVEEGNREAEGYVIRDGIIVILRNAVIPDNSIL